jgi:glutamate synthase (NADPH/NADH) large chain
LDEIAEEVAIRHRVAYPNQWTATPHRKLRTGGDYKWRRTGEDHLNDPESIFLLQQSTQRADYDMFKQYSAHINDTSNRLMTLRGLMFLHRRPQADRHCEVEPASEIVKRFSTGAMSYGSISQEAHETLAIAMNRSARAQTPARAANPTTASPTRAAPAASSRSPRAASA